MLCLLFMLDWFRDLGLRRRVQAGLNKGEARNALARAVFMHRLGEIRGRGLENQSYRASGLMRIFMKGDHSITSIEIG